MFTNDSRFALVPASVKTAITTALQANEETFVLRDVYEWLGYTTYGNAARAFENCEFTEGVDFITSDKFTGARQRKDYRLTADCFKAFAMQARTERGKQVRLYYIECERQLKRIYETKEMPVDMAIEMAMASLEREYKLRQSQMPGLVRLYEDVTKEKAIAPENKTAKEIAGDRISSNYLGSFGRYLTSLYVELYRTEPPKKLEDGRMVNSYPYTLWNAIDTYANR